MTKRFVADTCAILSYYHGIIGSEISVSDDSMNLLFNAFSGSSSVYLSIPSIVFVEVYEKWCSTKEMILKIQYEILNPILELPNIEIREIDDEILMNVFRLDDSIENLEAPDKIILSSAMSLFCPLITSDRKIINYVNRDQVIPSTIQ